MMIIISAVFSSRVSEDSRKPQSRRSRILGSYESLSYSISFQMHIFHVWARGSEVSFTAYRYLGKFTFSDTGKKFQYEYIPNYERQETRKRTRVTAHQEPKMKIISIGSQFHKKIYLLNQCSCSGYSPTTHKGSSSFS